MPPKADYLGEFEELVLLAILKLSEEEAYGVKIRQALEEAGRPTSIGALYTTTERLEEKGFVRSRQGDATPVRGEDRNVSLLLRGQVFGPLMKPKRFDEG